MSIETAYRARIAAMTVSERIRRAEELFNWSRGFLVRSITATRTSMPEADLKWEVALRQYGHDPATRTLIEELRGRDSR